MTILNPLANPIQNTGDSITPEQLERVKERAKNAVDNYVNTTVNGGMRSQRSVMDERKYQFAVMHKAGVFTHHMLEEEAKVREISVDALADLIAAKAEDANKIEVWRLTVRILIDRSNSRSGVIGILTEASVPVDQQAYVNV